MKEQAAVDSALEPRSQTPGGERPSLSVILISPDTFETVRRTVSYLAQQTIRDRLEIVLCLPSRGGVPIGDPLLQIFRWVAVVEIGNRRIVAEAKAAGIRKASAEFIAFIEEHAFPSPGWAESLVSRLAEGHAAAAGTMVNPNPRLAASWANFVVEYGPWAAPAEGGTRSHLPGNNGSYRKTLLLASGDRLEELLDAESLLQWELTAQGHTLWLEANAFVSHLNITRFHPFWKVHFHYARMFAAARSRRWSLARRAVYCGGSALIPALRLYRHLPDIWRCVPDCRRGMAFWMWLGFALAVSAAGESAGYLTNAGGAREEVFRLEFHRPRLLATEDLVDYPPLEAELPASNV